ncbi:flagellar hook-length control protein FliK [uncultured Sphingomonas sp.]|uniref:flagellar hook-length control protein FliK n=1 Tax=uncultured Sphingomonas sp. TaxID=158754 RepID=UPI0025E14677|nr:flagellar hook-length control protein FliK [uncultured Sphingomonas sp.]
MNVTNIGSPLATSATPAAGADAATGTGFAGLLGTGTANAAQAGLVFGTPVFGSFATTQPATIPAQTGAALLPGSADAETLPVSSDRPQVPMTQLLATAAPIAAAPTVVAGGNPLADAIAKALAKPVAPATGELKPSDVAAATPNPVEAAPKTPTAAQPANVAKTAVTRVLAKITPPADATAGQPQAGDGVALDAPAKPDADGLALPEATLPAKTSGKPLRTKPSDDLPAAPDVAVAGARAQPQPVAVPQATAVQAAPTVPAAPRTTATAKNEGTIAVRTSKVETAIAGDTTPTPAAADKTTELARAVAGQAGSGAADSGAKGEGNPQPFAQQLAAVDTRHVAVQPLPTATPTQAAAPAAAAHTAAPASGEPVINGRVGELGRSLGVEIARKVDAGEDTLRVRLNPAELGRVEVTLAFDDNGRVQATMRADSQHTLDLLRQDAPDLGRALDQAGIRSDAGSFRFESRDGGTGSNANGQSASQQQGQSRGSNQQFQDEPDIQTAAYRPVRSDGQVDLIA